MKIYKKILVIFFIVVFFVVLWETAQGLYNCGEYEGQAVQYSYYLFKQSPRVSYDFDLINGGLTNQRVENSFDYTQLHQYSAGFFNPFCGEVFNPFYEN